MGRGIFGEVYYKAITSQGLVAIKRMRIQANESAREHVEAALAEVAVLERCANHPHIVTLLDVAKKGSRMVLVFEIWGRDLEQSFRKVPERFSPERVRLIAKQTLIALDVLHNMGLIHADLKPENVLAVFDSDCASPSPSEPVHVKLADLGSCLVADPERRPHVKVEHSSGIFGYPALLAKSLEITTLAYRAPEVVFGDESFGTPIDIWALGVMVARFAGFAFTFTPDAERSEVGLREAWFRALGTPIGEDLLCLRAFQLYPACTPMVAAGPFPRDVLAQVGHDGCAVFRSWLSWRAQSRLSVSEVLDASFFPPHAFDARSPCAGEGVRRLANFCVHRRAPLLELRHWFCCARSFERPVGRRCDSLPARCRHASLPGCRFVPRQEAPSPVSSSNVGRGDQVHNWWVVD